MARQVSSDNTKLLMTGGSPHMPQVVSYNANDMPREMTLNEPL